MLQRIQTLFLTIALVCVALPLFDISLFTLKNGSFEIRVDAYSVNGVNYTQKHYYWLMLVFILLFLGFTIFLYKNRKLQLKLGWASFIMLFVLIGWIIVFIFFNSDYANAEKSLGFGLLSLIIALPLIYMGIRGIKKDQSLIDSLNRLR
jgi:hypothetical protein